MNKPTSNQSTAVEPAMLNTCLSNAKQEPAQAVGKVVTVGGYPDDSQHTVEWLVKHKDLYDGQLLYTHPAPLDSDTREAAITFCCHVLDTDVNALLRDSAKDLLSMLEAGNEQMQRL